MKNCFVIFAVLLALVLVDKSFASEMSLSKNFDSKSINEVEIRVESGDLRILGGHEETSTVDIGLSNGSKTCETRAEVMDRKLVIEVKNRSWLKTCKAKIAVKIPRRVELEVFTGAGRSWIKSIEGDLSIHTGSGDVKVHDSLIDDFEAKTGSGDISVSRVQGDVDILCGSGQVEVFYDDQAKKAEVEVKTGSGDLKLHLPSKASTEIRYKSFAGKLVNDFPTKKDGDFEVNYSSGSGSLSILKSRS